MVIAMKRKVTGRHLSIPMGYADWTKKLDWLREPEFAAAQSKGILPAIEWKGKVPTVEIVREFKEQGLYWGLHTPNNLPDTAYSNRDHFIEYMEAAASLKPDYLVVHGFEAMSDEIIPFYDPVERYCSRISAEQYLSAVRYQVALLKEMVAIMDRHDAGTVMLENTSVTEFAWVNGKFALPTYTLPRVGNWWKDTAMVAARAGAMPLCDIGHMTYGRNFYSRLENYSHLPESPVFSPRDVYEAELWESFGVGIRRGEFPCVWYNCTVLEAASAMGAVVFHLDGAYRESAPDGLHCDSHAPIVLDSERAKSIVGFLMVPQDIVISLEVDGASGSGGPFDWRPKDNYTTQHESWAALCQMVNDRLSI